MKFTKFRTQLFCLFLLVALIPLGTAGTIVYKYVYHRSRDDVSRQQQLVAHSLNRELQLLLSQRKFRIMDFSADGFVRDSVEQIHLKFPNYSQITKQLNSHLIIHQKNLDQDIIEIEILDSKGIVIASTSSDQIGKDRSHKDYFRSPFLLFRISYSKFGSMVCWLICLILIH